MNHLIGYFICRCQPCSLREDILQVPDDVTQLNELIFDNYSEVTLDYVKKIYTACQQRLELHFLHETPQLTTEQITALSIFRQQTGPVESVFCREFGMTSYMRQRRHRRFLEQADCLIIASDMPSAEINNAVRFARLHSKPIIDLNTADMHFRR